MAVIHKSTPDEDGYTTYTLDRPHDGDVNNGTAWVRLNGQSTFQLYGDGDLVDGQLDPEPASSADA